MCLYLSLSDEPVRSADSFVRLFVDRAGFLVSPDNTILVRSLLRTKPDKARISEEDIEKAFKAIQVALSAERDSGWRRGVPIICIEEVHVRGRDMIDTKSPLVARFLEWCSHLAQNQLAHIVFVTSIRAAMKLEEVAGLQYVRDLMFVDFPNEKRVRQVLENAETKLTDAEKDLVFEKFGGDMKVLVKVIYAIKRGTPMSLAVEDRIIEAVQLVEQQIMWLVSQILDASNDQKLRFDSAVRFSRFWRLMQMFDHKPKIRRNELMECIFGIHSRELRGYVAHGILTYTLRSVNHRLVGERRLQTKFPRTTWPDEWITVGSPCMREAFTRILGMPHYRNTYDWAEAVARGSELEEKASELTRAGDRLKDRTADAGKAMETLARNLDAWAGIYGEGGSAVLAGLWHEAFNRSSRLGKHSEALEEELVEVQRERRLLRAATFGSDHLVSPPRFATGAESSSATPSHGGSGQAEATGISEV